MMRGGRLAAPIFKHRVADGACRDAETAYRKFGEPRTLGFRWTLGFLWTLGFRWTVAFDPV